MNHIRQRGSTHNAIALGLATALVPSVSHAVLEKLIVTAQKREENVQTVPLAVSALNGESIRNGGIILFGAG